MKVRLIVLIWASFSLFSCITEKKEIKAKTPQNVILLIADGTGLSQVSSAFYFQDKEPNYARFETIGLINTSSSSHRITDSAAGATAFATGVQTYNGAIGVDPDTVDVTNLTEIVAAKKIKSGLIATSSITHATPAGFYAHNLSRSNAEAIAEDMLQANISFFAGGGLEYFNKRSDERNLLSELAENRFYTDTVGLKPFSEIATHEKLAFLLAEDGMPKMIEGRGSFLPDATQLGIDFLHKDKQPFFMMVEGSQVDWGGHDNNAEYLISELLDFDEAIGKALDFAEKDGNTLVIVTSDHETGGFSLSPKRTVDESGDSYSDYDTIEPSFATNGHSATLIPVFAYGPGADKFKGVYQNTAIFDKILEVTDWDK